MEMAQAVIAAAEEMNSPVIIQTTPSTVKYASLDLFFANVSALAEKTKVPVVIHLDPKKYGTAGRESVRRIVADRINVCGSGNHG